MLCKANRSLKCWASAVPRSDLKHVIRKYAEATAAVKGRLYGGVLAPVRWGCRDKQPVRWWWRGGGALTLRQIGKLSAEVRVPQYILFSLEMYAF